MENGRKEAFIAVGGLEQVAINAQPIPAWHRHGADRSMGLTLRDVCALQRSAPLVTEATPEMDGLSPVTIIAQTRAKTLATSPAPGPARSTFGALPSPTGRR
jgi:hypothetical protein